MCVIYDKYYFHFRNLLKYFSYFHIQTPFEIFHLSNLPSKFSYCDGGLDIILDDSYSSTSPICNMCDYRPYLDHYVGYCQLKHAQS